MDVVATALLFEMVGRCAAHVVGAVQVNLDDSVPLVHAHFVEEAITQNACVVNHHVDATKGVERGLNDSTSARYFAHAVGVGNRFTTQRFDLVHDRLRRACVVSFTCDRSTYVIDHDFGTFSRHGQSDVPANATACTGHHHNFARHHACSTAHIHLLI